MPEKRAVRKVPLKTEVPGRTKRGLRIDNDLYHRLGLVAKRQETTVTELINRAIAQALTEDAAKQEDATLGPLVEEVLKDRHGRLEAGLRTMLARVAHEVLRNQFLLCSFFDSVGVKPSQITTWRTQGYQWAVKDFRLKPKDEDASGGEEE